MPIRATSHDGPRAGGAPAIAGSGNVALARVLFVVVCLVGTSCGGTSTGSRTDKRVAASHAESGISPGTRPNKAEGPIEAEPEPYETFGTPAGPTETEAVRATVKQYFAAVAAGDSVQVCAMLYSTLAKAMPEDYGKSPPGPPGLSGKTCPEVMAKRFRHRSGLPVHDLRRAEVTLVRSKYPKAIALVRSGSDYGEIAVKQEGGVWKLWQVFGFGLS
jgi:hypothetical protein